MVEKVIYDVLPYPVVQYITLTPQLLFSGSLPAAQAGSRISIKVVTKPEELSSLKVLQPVGQARIKWGKEFPLLSLNYDIDDMKYRTNIVYVFGNPSPGKWYFYVFPCERLYRQTIYFEPYTWSGERIPMANRVYHLPPCIPPRI